MKMGIVLGHMWNEIFPKQKVAVFVDGCFWHGCPRHSSPAKWLKKSSMEAGGRIQKSGDRSQKIADLRSTGVRGRETGAQRGNGGKRAACPTIPRTGKEFWARKMAGNIRRDRLVNRELRRAGWKVVRIWEHELRKPAKVVGRISRVIHNG
jgi:G:T-mismatch repair DNA endonuclease (very short patch repair protein)